ncbi:hypothetical protein HOM50_04540 [bacterium]|nr:hypothetical protein [bacterium]MBT5015647.1 hypothetical protein [bacterium]
MTKIYKVDCTIKNNLIIYKADCVIVHGAI